VSIIEVSVLTLTIIKSFLFHWIGQMQTSDEAVTGTSIYSLQSCPVTV